MLMVQLLLAVLNKMWHNNAQEQQNTFTKGVNVTDMNNHIYLLWAKNSETNKTAFTEKKCESHYQ